MTLIAVLSACAGQAWEAEVVATLSGTDHDVQVVRRCVDVVDLLACAAAGHGRAALIAAQLVRFDVDACDRLRAADVVPVGIIARGDTGAEQALHAAGIEYVVAAESGAEVIASVIATAVGDNDRLRELGHDLSQYYSRSSSAVLPVPSPPQSPPSSGPGIVLAVWGPGGAPGRTSVAIGLVQEFARAGQSALLIDADVYGGVVAAMLGILDESPGLAAACRHAGGGVLAVDLLAALCWKLPGSFRVLTGISRADRWPEIRPQSLAGVITAARALADVTVIDCSAIIETDEELSFDTLAPRRNGATLEVLARADHVLVVASADPVGLTRLARAMEELREAELDNSLSIVLNRVHGKGKGLAQVVQGFAGREPIAMLPLDRSTWDRPFDCGVTAVRAGDNTALRKALTGLARTVTAGFAQSRVEVLATHR
jgi:MinD-like ATPase involved in chromosome partitioning or flagellar assembly